MIVAREVDASGPFELPDIPGATPQNSALIVSGFTATDTQVQVQAQVQQQHFACELPFAER